MNTIINKKTLLLLIGIFVISFSYSQVHNLSVEEIDQIVAITDNRNDLTLIKIDDDNFLDSTFLNQPGEGFGSLSGFYDKDVLILIVEMYGIHTPKDIAIVTYYIDHGKLIYVEESEDYSPSVFISPDGTVDYKDVSYDFEGQYYFTKDSFIDKTSGQQILIPNKEYFDSQSKEGQLQANAEKYSVLLKESLHNQ